MITGVGNGERVLLISNSYVVPTPKSPLLHFFYHVFTLISSRKPQPHPHELSYPRKQVPRHLALLLVSENTGSTSGDAVLECFLESIQRTAGWCGTVGIRKLTVCDRDGTPISIHPSLIRVTNYSTGILSANIEQVSQRLTVLTQHHSVDEVPEIEFPLSKLESGTLRRTPLRAYSSG